MTPTTWQGRYTPPAAPVTFALPAAWLSSEPLPRPSPLSIDPPDRLICPRADQLRSQHLSVGPDRPVWWWEACSMDWVCEGGDGFVLSCSPLRPAARATSPACGGRRSHAGVALSSPVHGGGARQGGGGICCWHVIPKIPAYAAIHGGASCKKMTVQAKHHGPLPSQGSPGGLASIFAGGAAASNHASRWTAGRGLSVHLLTWDDSQGGDGRRWTLRRASARRG